MNNPQLIEILRERFIKNAALHSGIDFETIIGRLTPKVLESLKYMEESGGEPDIIAYDKSEDKYIFFDTSKESPIGRRSYCYDDEALNSRKANKSFSSAMKEAVDHCVEILSEEDYFFLQSLGDFDLKSSSWLYTPAEIRNRGGAIFGDKHFGRTFIYHNGAESYYSNRGFRVKLRV
ncbi:MAG: DUF4256 domain-containing protein [Eubacteriales bacterium]|nr:DUF4256 domain-containing protein [Eubacteriales bacterium]